MKVQMGIRATFSLTSTLEGAGGQRISPATLHQGKRPVTDFTGDWVSPRAGQDGCGKSRPHQEFNPGPSSP